MPPRPDRHRVRSTAAVLLVVLASSLLAACGAARRVAPGGAPVSIALDFTPNPAHAPILVAAHDGIDRRLGVRLLVRTPGAGPDSLKLVLDGRVDIAVLDINDLGLARLRGADVVGIAALVQRPLGALIVRPGIRRPRDLEGQRVGVSGLPSDPAFLRAILARDGGRLSRVHQVTIGFDAVGQMIAGNIAGVPAFWSDEGVTLRFRGLRVGEFRIDDYGAPRFPEVVLVVPRRTLHGPRRTAIVHALAAIALGAQRTVADPDHAAAVVAAVAGGGDRRLLRAQTLAIAGALQPPLRLDLPVLDAWSRFDAATGLLPRAVDVRRAFDPAAAQLALKLAHAR